MPLCICFQCGRKMDCSGEGVCEICEIDAEGLKPGLTASGGVLQVETLSIDRQIHVILKQFHRVLSGPERECRWQHDDRKQVYWCQHVVIPARDVMEQYWRRFEKE